MTTYDPGPEAIHAAQAEQMPPAVEAAEFERQHFALSLVEKGLISDEFYRSGALDRFGSDEATGGDALSHILIGDELGGMHHLPTVMELGIQGRTVSSLVGDANRPKVSYSKFRREQRVKDSGAYRALGVEIQGPDGTKFSKLEGSSMFPNDWTTEKVLQSIVTVADTPGKHDPERKSLFHEAEVDGVKVRVVTDEKTGKIITASPKQKNRI